MKSFYSLIILILSITYIPTILQSQTVEKKVILQGFWWEYENHNYPDGWANYLADLAPRLRAMGIDAVWIPPTYKNSFTSSTGYAPFDHYDLGDKYQKGWDGNELDIRTRVGTKDEVLRMIAILHANGIEVLQDITLNHVTGAGTGVNGAGGLDPEPNYSAVSNSGYKNFRYVCYETPVDQTTFCGYANRKGRWPKNYMNFHPNPAHNVTNGNWEIAPWGPDLSYGIDEAGNGNGFGPSSNLCDFPSCIGECYDPPQENQYNRNHARDWMMWFKKQTGVDGYRWDAVKHFPYFVQQDLSYNCKYELPDWAAGGTEMFNVGEYVGSKNELDAFVDDVTFSNGGNEMMMGTFDFGLRAFDDNGGIYSMVTSGGFFDMATLPAAQQERRYSDFNGMRVHRTVPMVNNHDTFRPVLDSDGDYQGWNSGSELSPHIYPYDDRLALAYAVIMAVDGNPQIFLEDLFDIGINGNRFNHNPKTTNPNTGLPAREPIVNLIWCHQNLDFKGGDYKVRSTASGGNVYFNPGSSAGDLLAIERSGKAIIGLNDRADEWQSCYVDTDFAPGTVLVDYSGANGTDTYVVPADGRVNVNTPPVNPSEGWYGYSVWAPQGLGQNSYTPDRSVMTSQEWEMSDDLGDSHCKSLGQGGQLPAQSCSYRIAGKIYPEANTTAGITVYKTEADEDITVSVYNANGDIIARESGTQQPVEITFNVPQTGWYSIKVRNNDDTQLGQVVYVRADYQAPMEISAINDFATPQVSMWNGNGGTCDWNDCSNWDEGLVPTTNTMAIIPECVMVYPCIPDGHPTNLLDDRSEFVSADTEWQLDLELSVIPNPFSTAVQLVCRDCQDTYDLEIINSLGQVILSHSGQFEELSQKVGDLSVEWDKGLYIIRLTQNGKHRTEKVIKM